MQPFHIHQGWDRDHSVLQCHWLYMGICVYCPYSKNCVKKYVGGYWSVSCGYISMWIPLSNETSFFFLKMWPVGLKLKVVDITRSHDLRLTLVLVLYLKYKSMKFVSAIYFKGLVNHLFLDNSVSELLSILKVHSQPKPDLCWKEAKYLTANDAEVLLSDLSPRKELLEKLIIDPFFQICYLQIFY